MIIRNKRKIISMTVAMAIVMSCSTSFAENNAEADAAVSENAAVEADVSADTTVNGSDVPDFADVLASSSVFDDIDIGIKSEVDIELPTTEHNNRAKLPEQTESSNVTPKPVNIDADVDLNALRSGSCGIGHIADSDRRDDI